LKLTRFRGHLIPSDPVRRIAMSCPRGASDLRGWRHRAHEFGGVLARASHVEPVLRSFAAGNAARAHWRAVRGKARPEGPHEGNGSDSAMDVYPARFIASSCTSLVWHPTCFKLGSSKRRRGFDGRALLRLRCL